MLNRPVSGRTCRSEGLQLRVNLDSGVPRNFFGRGGVGSINSVEDRGQREWGSDGIAPYSGILEAAAIWYNKFNFI